jgi:hypothetical protein
VKIELRIPSSSGGGAYTLCDGTTTFTGDDFRKKQTRSVQVTAGLRWQKVKTVDRGNRAIQVSFTVSNKWATVTTAARHVLTYADTIPTMIAGDIYFYWATNTPSIMRDAVIQDIESWQFGVTTWDRYTILGGKMSISESDL